MFDDARFTEEVRRRIGILARGDPGVYCASCMAIVTAEGERIAMQGAHRHTFTNPSGFTFTIGCFRRAPGCCGEGSDTQEHTWFPGYAWRYGLCRSCRTHLGWVFSAGGRDRFYGLILDRLIFGKDISQN